MKKPLLYLESSHTKKSVVVSFLLLLLLNINTFAQTGTWTQVTNFAPNSNGGFMFLLSDGRVMCKTSAGGASYGNIWNILTPNINGSYANGTWSTPAPMADTRLYFATQVLKDGRVYVCGGEYGTGGSKGEVYNPVTNSWTATPAPGSFVSDANSEILPDGRVMQALVNGSLKNTLIYNPINNTYIPGPTCIGIHNESTWIKQKDQSILMVDRGATTSERYIPASNTWTADATVPVQLYDGFGLETGPAFQLPDGRSWFMGSTNKTAYYTPSGTNAPGTWSVGPNQPNNGGCPDAGGAMMINGKILCVGTPSPISGNVFQSPTSFFEFDYTTNLFTQINAPTGALTLSNPAYVHNFLCLPNGQVMYCRNGSTVYYVYTPVGSQLAVGVPTINTITQVSCKTYSATGLLFNGISEGAIYGDDWQMNTNFPVFRLWNGSNVYYARSYNWNRTDIQTGSLVDSVYFDLPANLPGGMTYSIVVTANGYASKSWTLNPYPGLSSTLSPPAICSGKSFTYQPTSTSSSPTFSWTRAAVGGISNPAITIPQGTNPNEVLNNVTSSPISVIYSYTTISGPCPGVNQVTVVVNPLPSLVVTANDPICSGSSSTLSVSGGTAYVWFDASTNTSVIVSPTTTTSYSVNGTNGYGCSTSTTYTVNVNALPTISITGSLSICPGDSTTLTGNGGVSYVWSNSATTSTITVKPTTTTVYSVTGTDANGCNGTKQTTVTVNTVNWSVSGPTSICQGDSVTLTAGGAGTYLWGTGSTNASIGANPPSSTWYSVKVTNAFGCSKTDSVFITVNACVGIKEVGGGISKNAYIYPNPANDKVTLVFTVKNAGDYLVKMVDIFGREVREESNIAVAGENTHLIYFNGISEGVYMIILQKGGETFKTKLIVKQ